MSAKRYSMQSRTYNPNDLGSSPIKIINSFGDDPTEYNIALSVGLDKAFALKRPLCDITI
jgi:hypothetical protein